MSTRVPTPRREARGGNVTPLPDGSICLTLHFPVDGPEAIRSEEIIVRHEDGWTLLTNLTNTLHSQANERMRNAVAGDCETCQNHRLFMQPTGSGGRMEYAHCPDCWERYDNASPAYPTPREDA
jgi:hypothetical protein